MIVVALLAGRWSLGLVFWASGVAKLTDRAGTQATARRYGLADPLAYRVSFVLAPAEVGLAVGLMVGVALPVVGLVSAVLLVSFGTAMARSLRVGLRFPCGCGAAGREISWLMVARNLVLAGVGTVVAVVPPAGLAALPLLPRPLPPVGVIDLLPVPAAVVALGFAVRCASALRRVEAR